MQIEQVYVVRLQDGSDENKKPFPRWLPSDRFAWSEQHMRDYTKARRFRGPEGKSRALEIAKLWNGSRVVQVDGAADPGGRH